MKSDIRSDVEESDSSNDEAVPKGLQLKNKVVQESGAAMTNGLRSRAVGHLTNGHTQAT